jgi:ligand-binding SRPBCC domain-containing protein
MPEYARSIQLARSAAEVFDLFSQPALLLDLAPPELPLELVDAPPRLQLGSRLCWKIRRWGISQRLTCDVTAFEKDRLIVETQRVGPFGRWEMRRRFQPLTSGMQLNETIDFEPPRGILGRLATEETILQELQILFEFRERKLKELFD